MIFVDSNIPMYLAGNSHPLKTKTIALLKELVLKKAYFVTNAEVLQEILHRYTALNRKEAINLAMDALYGFVEKVYDVTEADVLAAKEMIFSYPTLSARDALHAAQIKRLKIKIVFSFDKGFDLLPYFTRIPTPDYSVQ